MQQPARLLASVSNLNRRCTTKSPRPACVAGAAAAAKKSLGDFCLRPSPLPPGVGLSKARACLRPAPWSAGMMVSVRESSRTSLQERSSATGQSAGGHIGVHFAVSHNGMLCGTTAAPCPDHVPTSSNRAGLAEVKFAMRLPTVTDESMFMVQLSAAPLSILHWNILHSGRSRITLLMMLPVKLPGAQGIAGVRVGWGQGG